MGRLIGISAVGVVAVGSASAFGGFLATDATAIAGWHGSTPFVSAALNVNVDFAVYAPGTYGLSDPSGGTRYVYAYQVFNVGSRAVSNLTVGLTDPTVGYDGGFDPTRPTPGGVMPLFQDSLIGTAFEASSFRSIFQAAGGPFTKVNPGQHSQVLLFTSPNAPQLFVSSVIDEGEQVQRFLPSPAIPGPAAVTTLALAGVASLRRRRSI